MIIGDWNAKVETNNNRNKHVMGFNGIGRINGNGTRLIQEFAR